jgi:hypothetical protein
VIGEGWCLRLRRLKPKRLKVETKPVFCGKPIAAIKGCQLLAAVKLGVEL